MLEAWLLVALINGQPQLMGQFESQGKCAERKELLRVAGAPEYRGAPLECYRKEVVSYPGIPG